MDRFARTVLGYHGCEPDFAEALFRGEIGIDDWEPSRNPWDWLGHGIYFWEHAPERARDWMGKGGVVGAILQTGECLDFTDTLATRLLSRHFDLVRQAYLDEGKVLPVNRGKRADLDCTVINDFVESMRNAGTTIDTLRCPFLEGSPAFEGSAIRAESHVQLVVRTPACILGVFRPNLSRRGGDA